MVIFHTNDYYYDYDDDDDDDDGDDGYDDDAGECIGQIIYRPSHRTQRSETGSYSEKSSNLGGPGGFRWSKRWR